MLDLDSDDAADILIGEIGVKRILINHGAGTFRRQPESLFAAYLPPGNAFDIAVHDFDGTSRLFLGVARALFW